MFEKIIINIYFSTVSLKDYNVMINGRNPFDEPVKMT